MSPPSVFAAKEVRDAAPVFAALGDATRLRLVIRLSDGPESITRLTSKSPVSRQAITKHLSVLSSAGLVRDQWRGRERIWQLEPKRLSEARAYLERISQQWDDALGRLKRFVEDGP
jgi:DNA-binding transcriptional ArsR family regulator